MPASSARTIADRAWGGLGRNLVQHGPAQINRIGACY
jgi:hypothetical protein